MVVRLPTLNVHSGRHTGLEGHLKHWTKTKNAGNALQRMARFPWWPPGGWALRLRPRPASRQRIIPHIVRPEKEPNSSKVSTEGLSLTHHRQVKRSLIRTVMCRDCLYFQIKSFFQTHELILSPSDTHAWVPPPRGLDLIGWGTVWALRYKSCPGDTDYSQSWTRP